MKERNQLSYHPYHRITLIAVLFLCLLASIISPSLASVYSAQGSDISSENLTSLIRSDPSLLSGNLPSGQVVFFTNSLCEQCQSAEDFFHTFLPDHPEITLHTYDLVNSAENRTVFENYKVTYQRKFLSTPSVMIGNLTLEGPEDIRKNLPVLVSLQNNGGVSAGNAPGVVDPSLPNTGAAGGDIPLPLIIGAGLLDGINPCAFAVLVFLLVYLMAQKSRRTMLIAGLVYTSAVFIFYYLSGVGIFSVVQTTGATTAFSIGAGCISLIAGLIMMKDAVFPKEKPTLGIPASQSGLINRVMKRATMPAAFILGILVGMFELPCTGGIYLSIISMISLKSNMSQALGYLFVYNLAFILPLLIIIALVTFGLPPERVTEWRLEQRRALRGIIGLVLIAFAVFILYEVLA